MKTNEQAPIPFLPQAVSRLELAFPADVSRLMPKREDIPEEFKRHRGTKWHQVFADWFYRGLEHPQWTPKPGIDTAEALRHIGTIMGSWEPKHEHKEAACAYLMSLWFEGVTYTPGKRD